jgi:hypothetical protein
MKHTDEEISFVKLEMAVKDAFYAHITEDYFEDDLDRKFQERGFTICLANKLRHLGVSIGKFDGGPLLKERPEII